MSTASCNITIIIPLLLLLLLCCQQYHHSTTWYCDAALLGFFKKRIKGRNNKNIKRVISSSSPPSAFFINNKPKEGSTATIGEVAYTIESFKKTQEMGRRTSKFLAQDLENVVVKGSAKSRNSTEPVVTVTYNAQQRPISIDIVDEAFFKTATKEEFSQILLDAFNDAYNKSTAEAALRMKVLYDNLGFDWPSNVDE